MSDGFFKKPFDAWLHDNLSSNAGSQRLTGNWGMKFLIWCWLLWKRLVVETDNKEVERIVYRSSLTLAASVLVMAILEWMDKDWDVSVQHICRERNGVTGSLATMRRDHGLHGSTFVIPPRHVGAQVEEERHGWVSILLAEAVGD
ncbi:hypothetical protein V6N12_023353 [Hibiscus sabdariffa]|uniref:RNase H type-1 domain-containing protein n=1 Tax=Hibiscus sabdariffa TaxID=183260 RepID=A0ABR2FYB9_9ROSI